MPRKCQPCPKHGQPRCPQCRRAQKNTWNARHRAETNARQNARNARHRAIEKRLSGSHREELISGGLRIVARPHANLTWMDTNGRLHREDTRTAEEVITAWQRQEGRTP
jgi:hypothetical protein